MTAYNRKVVAQMLVATKVTRTERYEDPEPDANGGRVFLTSRPDGVKEAVVDLWIDVDALTQDLGARAIKSRGKKARMAHGMIEARVRGTITHYRQET